MIGMFVGGLSNKILSNAVIEINTFTHNSTIDAGVTGLYCKYAYDESNVNMPILVLAHGITATADNFADATYQRFANYGFFVLGISFRGEHGATGSKDYSARELHDIIDAVEYVKTNFAAKVNPERLAITGYSGGGGNVYGMVCKFPDYFNMHMAYFGMSDYGYTATGWYQTDPDAETGIQGQAAVVPGIGGTPTEKPNEYRSRNAREAINNFGLLTPLYIFHDTEDPYVDIIHGREINTAITNTLKQYRETTIGDAQRWYHDYPTAASSLPPSEVYWKDEVFTTLPVTVPDSATIKVIGYIKTKKFEIWLGNGTASLDGTNRTATVQYNVINSTYTVTPHFEGTATSCVVKITEGAKSKTQTITGVTTIDLNATASAFPLAKFAHYYKLDSATGGVLIDELGANNGTLVNATIETGGKFGSSYSSTGVNGQYGQLNNVASVKLSIGSISMWIKTADAGASNKGVLLKQNAYGIYLTSNKLATYSWGAPVGIKDTGILVNNNQWRHIALTFQSGVTNGSKLYLDGALVMTTTITISNQNVGLSIGAGNNPGTFQTFIGQIDEIGISKPNEILTPEEVLEIWNDGVGTAP